MTIGGKCRVSDSYVTLYWPFCTGKSWRWAARRSRSRVLPLPRRFRLLASWLLLAVGCWLLTEPCPAATSIYKVGSCSSTAYQVLAASVGKSLPATFPHTATCSPLHCNAPCTRHPRPHPRNAKHTIKYTLMREWPQASPLNQCSTKWCTFSNKNRCTVYYHLFV